MVPVLLDDASVARAVVLVAAVALLVVGGHALGLHHRRRNEGDAWR